MKGGQENNHNFKKAKYKIKKMKALHTTQANVETLLQAAEVAEEQ